jgi:hypothetical protein
MNHLDPHIASTRVLERWMAVAGGCVCLAVSAWAWLVLSVEQSMWPLPDLYLLEMTAAGAVAMWAILSGASKQAALHGKLMWALVGVLLAFVVMGSWTIGFLYAPAAVLFAIAAILSDKRHGENTGYHLGIAVMAAFTQVVLMLAIIRTLSA